MREIPAVQQFRIFNPEHLFCGFPIRLKKITNSVSVLRAQTQDEVLILQNQFQYIVHRLRPGN